ncbi:metalloprotease TIKI1 [Arapaima gigas]
MQRFAWGAWVHALVALLVHAKPIARRTGNLDPPLCEKGEKSNMNSFLWTIKGDPPSFFFGTIHVPYTMVWDFIPENSKKAFNESNAVYFELDLVNPKTFGDLTRCQLLPHGGFLRELLPNELYDRLKRHLEYVRRMMPSWLTDDQIGEGLYPEFLFRAMVGDWERKRPMWMMFILNGLTEDDVQIRGSPVLDYFLAQEADRTKKEMGAVETVEEQCLPMNGLTLSEVTFALNQSLLHQEKLRDTGQSSTYYTTSDLIKHYNCGDLDAVIFSRDTTQVPIFSDSNLAPNERLMAQQIDNFFQQELIYKRNERMSERVQELLQKHPNKSLFFAFGAGHFLGNNTVIDFMRRKGYEVEHTPAGQPIYSHKPIQVGQDQCKTQGAMLPDATHHDLNKKQLNKAKKPTQRHFNDLWVRLEDRSAEDSQVHIRKGYITVQPKRHGRGRVNLDQAPVSSASALPDLLLCILCSLLLAVCFQI